MGWTPTTEVLERSARTHIAAVFHNMRFQTTDVELAKPPGAWSHHTDALLEAALIHLRLLDGFLTTDPAHLTGLPPRDDVVAGHYTDGRTFDTFLLSTPDERDRIDTQLTHLGARRMEHYHWPLEDMAQRCARRFLDFEAALNPGMRPWFEESLIHARALTTREPGHPG